MKVPFNMTTPKMKLHDGEQVLHVQEGMRKKGIFGNRFGELYITTHRVAFVKAIMKAGLLGAAIKAMGAKPILEFDRTKLRAEKVAHKKMVALVITAGEISERFLVEPHAIDAVLALLAPQQAGDDAPSVSHYKS